MINFLITQKYLKDNFIYNADTGDLINKMDRNYNSKKGKIVGSIRNNGYLGIRLKGKNYLVHRLIWLYVYGKFPDKNIDHIDRNRTNNRIINLRDVSHKVNSRNMSLSKVNKTGVTGVCYSKKRKKYESKITVDGKTIHLGRYKNLEKAKEVRKKAEKELW